MIKNFVLWTDVFTWYMLSIFNTTVYCFTFQSWKNTDRSNKFSLYANSFTLQKLICSFCRCRFSCSHTVVTDIRQSTHRAHCMRQADSKYLACLCLGARRSATLKRLQSVLVSLSEIWCRHVTGWWGFSVSPCAFREESTATTMGMCGGCQAPGLLCLLVMAYGESKSHLSLCHLKSGFSLGPDSLFEPKVWDHIHTRQSTTCNNMFDPESSFIIPRHDAAAQWGCRSFCVKHVLQFVAFFIRKIHNKDYYSYNKMQCIFSL